MKYFSEFLESSTIHGLVYISTAKRFAKLFWILVVVLGFTISGLLIKQAVYNWKHSPIKTTVETTPISDFTFPTVSVCPPQDTFTHLNYVLMKLNSVTMTNDSRHQLNEFAKMRSRRLIHLLDNVEKYINMDNDLFYNLYYGYTKWPESSIQGVKHITKLTTTATSGSIQTFYFGEDFVAENNYPNVNFVAEILLPDEILNDNDYTLTLNIEKLTMDLQTHDKVILKGDYITKEIAENVVSLNFTERKSPFYKIALDRMIVFPKDIYNLKLKTNPGFKVTWNFNKFVFPHSKYITDSVSVLFQR